MLISFHLWIKMQTTSDQIIITITRQNLVCPHFYIRIFLSKLRKQVWIFGKRLPFRLPLGSQHPSPSIKACFHWRRSLSIVLVEVEFTHLCGKQNTCQLHVLIEIVVLLRIWNNQDPESTTKMIRNFVKCPLLDLQTFHHWGLTKIRSCVGLNHQPVGWQPNLLIDCATETCCFRAMWWTEKFY